MKDNASNPPFDAAELRGMIAHMNEDHADSVLAYARHFGVQPRALSARLLDVTPTDMLIEAATPDGEEHLTIPFDHRLESAHDAHMTMVKMSKQAKRSFPD